MAPISSMRWNCSCRMMKPTPSSWLVRSAAAPNKRLRNSSSHPASRNLSLVSLLVSPHLRDAGWAMPGLLLPAVRVMRIPSRKPWARRALGSRIALLHLAAPWSICWNKTLIMTKSWSWFHNKNGPAGMNRWPMGHRGEPAKGKWTTTTII
jgi:hypothetical protein